MLLWRKHRLVESGMTTLAHSCSKPSSLPTLWKAAGWTSLLVTSAFLTGCKTTEDADIKYAGKDRDMSYYKDAATKIDYPNVAQEQAPQVAQSSEPRRLRHPTKDQIWDMGIDEAIRTALTNSEVLKDNGSFLSPGNRLLNNPDFTQSVYDVAIQETNILFGQGGPEAALSEFDAQFTTNMTYGLSKQISDSGTIGFNRFDEQREDVVDARLGLSKIFRNGDSIQLGHNVFYSDQNQSGLSARPFPSEYTSRPGRGQDAGLPMFLAEYRAPLLAGSGSEYTGIAGPIARRPTLASTPNVNQGVVIARIRTDISIADFEEAVATMVKDVEETYWDLMLAYRTYDAETMSRNSSLQTWREVRANMEAGKVGAADEAQARDNFYEIRARTENALAGLYQAELRLRRLLGLAVNDGRVIRPADDPITAELNPEWHTSLAEALVMRPELRKQKWNIKSLELQYEASQSLIRPRLDFVARTEVNGFGDNLISKGTAPAYRTSAYESLLDGEQAGYTMGFEFSMPLGFRGAHAQVQNYEHRLGKARSILANQELEVSHELANSLQQLDQSYATAKTNFNRRRAAERRLQAFEAEYKVGRTTLDQLLRSQISLAQAEIAYFQSLIGYNRAIAEVKYRKGTTLREAQVYLTESMWTPDAYAQAMRKAWARSYAFDSPNQSAQPEEFVLENEETQLTAQPAEWHGYAEPIQPQATESVPVPAEPTPAGIPPSDNRSAELDTQGLGTNLEEQFVPPVQTPEPTSSISPDLPMPPADGDQFVPPLQPTEAATPGTDKPPFLGASSSRRKASDQHSNITSPRRVPLPSNESSDDFMTPITRQPIEQVGGRSTSLDSGVEQATHTEPRPEAKAPATHPRTATSKKSSAGASRSQLLRSNPQ